MKNNMLEFWIFRKYTHADNYIKANSDKPVTLKHAIINSLANILVNVPLNSVEYQKEYNCIIESAGKKWIRKNFGWKKIKAQRPFLDLKIITNNIKLEFGIFRKYTHADNYIKANSYNHVTHKHAIIIILVYRLVDVPLNSVEYKKRI